MPGRNDAERGPVNSLHSWAYYSEHNEEYNLKIYCLLLLSVLHLCDLEKLKISLLEFFVTKMQQGLTTRGGVEDTRLEAKAKDTKKIQGQGQPFRGQTLSRPRTGMLEAKAKDQGHKRKCSPKKKKGLYKIFFRRSPKKKKKKVFTKIFQAISTKKRFPKNFSSAPQNFNNSKNSVVLEPRTGQFSRASGLEAKDLTFEAKAKDFKMCPRGRPRDQRHPRGLHLC